MCLCCHILNLTQPYSIKRRLNPSAMDMSADKTMMVSLTRIRDVATPDRISLSIQLLLGALAVIGMLAVTGVFQAAQAQDTAPDSSPAAKAIEAAKGMLPEGVQPLPVPRFVTLGPEEVNLRTGPGIRYPIRLVIRKQGLPVEVIREFDVWRQIRDKDGDEGWVHKSMLSGRRSAVTIGSTQVLLRKPDESARPVVRLEPGVIATLDKCEAVWCRLAVGGYDGWIKRDVIWGVYADEEFKD